MTEATELTFNGYTGPSYCNFYNIKVNNEDLCVIEQLDKTTTSITNVIEDIAVHLIENNLTTKKTKFITWYPAERLKYDPTIDFQHVDFDSEFKPSWYPISDELKNDILNQIN